MTFIECLEYCAQQNEFVKEFDRLSGTHLSNLGQRSALDAMIDEATGRDKDALDKFADFVFRYIYMPLVAGYFVPVPRQR